MTSNEILFLIGAAVFAITGVLAAARQNMDVMSFVIIGVVTAVGGGTLRDITLDTRVFWLQDPTSLYVAASAAVAAFFFEQVFRATYQTFLYLDAIGTAVFSVLTAERTLSLGFAPGTAVAMAVLTGIGGGVIRDVLSGQPTILTRRELYLTPILVGVLFYVGVVRIAPAEHQALAIVAMILVAVLRTGAIRWGWAFPDWLTYKPLR